MNYNLKLEPIIASLLLGLVLNLLWILNLFEFVTMPNLSIEIFICLLLMITNLPTVITSEQKEKNK